MVNLPKSLVKISRLMAGPVVIFWCMPYLIFLIVMATVTQKSLGLYDAVHTYLYNFILWVGPIPLPGGGMALLIIFLCLLVKFLFYSQWSVKRTGIILSHLGVLILLLGGIVTYFTTKEGFMIIGENDTSQYYYDYKKRVFSISSDEKRLVTLPFQNLKKGQEILITGTDMSVTIIDLCANCDVVASNGTLDNPQGMAKNMALNKADEKPNKEENFSGVVFEVSFKDRESQSYIALEDLKIFPIIDDVRFELTREARKLPFSITLNDFQKIDYQGTQKAQNYLSDITLEDNGIQWPTRIEMNKPFRYKGYSFYQSSFDQTGDQEKTVLNVVKNSGRIFPYLSSLIIFIGLTYHVIYKIVMRRRKQEKKRQKNA